MAFRLPFGRLTTPSASSSEDGNWSAGVVDRLPNLWEIEWDCDVAEGLGCVSDNVILTSGACSGCAAAVRDSPTCTTGFGAGRAASARAATAARSASAAALCDDRTCCSELLGSVIRAVANICHLERDPDDPTVLWVVPVSTSNKTMRMFNFRRCNERKNILNCPEIMFASRNGINYLL